MSAYVRRSSRAGKDCCKLQTAVQQPPADFSPIHIKYSKVFWFFSKKEQEKNLSTIQ